MNGRNASRPVAWRPILRRLSSSRPDLLAAHAAAPARFPFLLESASAGGTLGRYDLLLATRGETLMLDADGRVTRCDAGSAVRHTLGGGQRPGFLAALDDWWRAARRPEAAAGLPFTGGWFLYLGYELAGEIEPRLRLPQAPGTVAAAVRVPAAAVYEHATGASWLVGEPGAEDLVAALEAALQPAAGPAAATVAPLELVLAEDDPAIYLAAVARALEHIAAGDIYQANLARAWRGSVPAGVGAADLYASLRRANPGPFAGLAALGDCSILSTSPERLVSVRGDLVDTRPIAGTRPRRGDDATVMSELRANAKEQAEHVMLLDLERNDLGRICTAGSVEVNEWMTIESYAHVHHIVSNVRGRRRPDVTPGEVIRALFPGGTITGCPKVRCMEIIAELEAQPRGAYTGSMGYLGLDGSLDLNILIRTATLRAAAPGAVEPSQLELRAGAGIVADSIPERELEETRAKARGLLRGLTGERA